MSSFLRFFQIAHEAILVFDLVEPQGRKIPGCPGSTLAAMQGQLISLPGLDKGSRGIPPVS